VRLRLPARRVTSNDHLRQHILKGSY
jgi:hypothetical protein